MVDEWGSALAGATVGAQGRTVLTGRDGTYVLGLDASPDAPVRVFAARAGRATRVQDLDAGAAATRTLDWTLPPAETIRGSVTSHDGRPLSGAFVVPWGEAPVCGLLGPTDLAQPSTRASVHFFGRTRPAVALTDDAGRFALGGFGPGAHRLGVVSSSGVLLLLSGPLAAREEALELVIPADPFRVLRGRVVDRTGRPARGVTVVAGLQVLKLGNADIWSDVRCTATTDAAGAFEFTHLPRCASTVLSLDHPPQLYEQVFVDPGTDAEVEIEMEPLAYFRLELADTAVDRPRVRLLDGEGRSVPVVEAHQSAWFSAATTVPLIGGRSQVLAVPRRAATIALDGVPQGGPSILWRPDGVTTIRG